MSFMHRNNRLNAMQRIIRSDSLYNLLMCVIISNFLFFPSSGFILAISFPLTQPLDFLTIHLVQFTPIAPAPLLDGPKSTKELLFV